MTDVLPQIPRLYTALAEWLACMVYVAVLRKELKSWKFIVSSIGALLLQCIIQECAGLLPLVFWIPGMVCAVALMFVTILFCCSLNVRDAGFCCVRAFVGAEFAASFEWQLSCYMTSKNILRVQCEKIPFLLMFYLLIFMLMFLLETRHMPRGMPLSVSRKELTASIFILLTFFLLSNLSFVYGDTPFSVNFPTGIFYIRTLVDFSGLVIMYEQQEQRSLLQLRHELGAMQNILYRQYEQYKMSKDNIDTLNRKYHDMKYQIAAIRNESSPEMREKYLQEMESDIKVYEAQNKTGNSVLDTVLTGKSLYCVKHDITLTCMAEGTLLNFMNVIDICTIFGNALDNAIEYVKKIGDKEKRLINLAVYAKGELLMLRFENYCEDTLNFENGLPLTTKEDASYHGYGIKSIRSIAEKYGGSITIHSKRNWFTLCVLIPRQT